MAEQRIAKTHQSIHNLQALESMHLLWLASQELDWWSIGVTVFIFLCRTLLLPCIEAQHTRPEHHSNKQYTIITYKPTSDKSSPSPANTSNRPRDQQPTAQPSPTKTNAKEFKTILKEYTTITRKKAMNCIQNSVSLFPARVDGAKLISIGVELVWCYSSSFADWDITYHHSHLANVFNTFIHHCFCPAYWWIELRCPFDRNKQKRSQTHKADRPEHKLMS